MTRQSSVEGGDVHIFSGPISTSNAGEEDVKREPDRQIEDDADDGPLTDLMDYKQMRDRIVAERGWGPMDRAECD
jgi:hypothetical protein